MTNLTQSLKVILLAIVLSFGISYVFAWTAPTLPPTGGNDSMAPLNTSNNDQTKNGNLFLNALGITNTALGALNVAGGAVFGGNVGIGTATPTEKLDVAGNVSILPSIGSEQIDNGTFENLSYWDFNKNWTLDAINHEADHTIGENNNLQQRSPTTPIIAGRTYQVVFTVKNSTAGSVRPRIGGTPGLLVTSNSISTQQITTNTTGTLNFDPSIDFDGSIDDVSLKILSDGNLNATGDITASGTVCDGAGACIGALVDNFEIINGARGVTYTRNHTGKVLIIYSANAYEGGLNNMGWSFYLNGIEVNGAMGLITNQGGLSPVWYQRYDATGNFTIKVDLWGTGYVTPPQIIIYYL